jgi:dipeptidyl aminopeptidase/acylaminoacyl peptidase
VYRVSAKGGTVSPVTTIDASRGDNAHYWPVLLPGGKKFIFFLRSTRVENGGIYLGYVDGAKPPVRLVASLSSGFVARRPSDGAMCLFWVRDAELLSQAFDAEAGVLSGEIVTVASDVRVETSQRLAFASASSTGVLVWAGARAAEQTLARYSRDGRRIGALPIPPGDISQPALSPDGRRLAFLRVVNGAGDVFVLDIANGAIQRVSPSPDYDELPSWSPDSSAVFYLGRLGTERVVFKVAPGGGTQPVVVSASDYGRSFATSDGKFIVSSVFNEKTGLDLMFKSTEGDGPLVPLLEAPGDQSIAAMSADSRWVVVTEGAVASLRRLIVEGGKLSLGAPFPLGLTQLSNDAVTMRRDGREVFSLSSDNTLKVVSVTPAGNGVVLGPPTTLFKLPVGEGSFDVNADGTEFILNETPFGRGQTLRVLTNWERRLKR